MNTIKEMLLALLLMTTVVAFGQGNHGIKSNTKKISFSTFTSPRSYDDLTDEFDRTYEIYGDSIVVEHKCYKCNKEDFEALIKTLSMIDFSVLDESWPGDGTWGWFMSFNDSKGCYLTFNKGSRVSGNFRQIMMLIINYIRKHINTKSNNSQTQTLKSNCTIYVGDSYINMIYVEGGTFNMSGKDITVPSFYIGKSEVTQSLWEAVMNNNPSTHKGKILPVENISKDDCVSFLDEMNRKSGMKFRLLTDAEWEYAARGGKYSKGYIYSGSNIPEDVAWFKDNSERRMHRVMAKNGNELGIYDMSGNVWEWCKNTYRGGSFSDSKDECQVLISGRDAFVVPNSQLGLRVALSACELDSDAISLNKAMASMRPPKMEGKRQSLKQMVMNRQMNRDTIKMSPPSCLILPNTTKIEYYNYSNSGIAIDVLYEIYPDSLVWYYTESRNDCALKDVCRYNREEYDYLLQALLPLKLSVKDKGLMGDGGGSMGCSFTNKEGRYLGFGTGTYCIGKHSVAISLIRSFIKKHKTNGEKLFEDLRMKPHERGEFGVFKELPDELRIYSRKKRQQLTK